MPGCLRSFMISKVLNFNDRTNRYPFAEDRTDGAPRWEERVVFAHKEILPLQDLPRLRCDKQRAFMRRIGRAVGLCVVDLVVNDLSKHFLCAVSGDPLECGIYER